MIEEVTKGWSVDKKYKVEDDSGIFLVRIRQSSEQTMKARREIVEKINSLEVPVPKLVYSKILDNNQIFIFSWLEGEPLEGKINYYSKQDQYQLGLQAGKYLKLIHEIRAPKNTPCWNDVYSTKIDDTLRQYNEGLFSFDDDKLLYDYIISNRHLINGLDNYLQHGDYHIGNMLIDNDEIKIIDLDRCDYGERIEEYNRYYFTSRVSKHFARGQIDGYIKESDKEEFFKLMLLYECVNLFRSFSWAMSYGKKEIETTYSLCKYILSEYNNLTTVYPNWYKNK